MTRDPHGEAVQRLFDRQPTEKERRRLERMLRNLSPDVRNDPGLFELLVVLNDFFFEFERRVQSAVAAAEAEARMASTTVYEKAARSIAQAHPELKVARQQSLMLMSVFGLVITLLVYLSLVGLLKTGFLTYPHLSSAEQEQLALGREIEALGNRDAAIWAAGAVESSRDLNEIAVFTRKLSNGENALDELAQLRQCRSGGAQVAPYQGRWICWFPLNNQ